MIRIALWVLAALYLLLVGLWPAALAPVALALSGATTLIAAVPGVVWVAAGVIAWLKHKSTPTPAKTA
ncbi:hypothetical protein OG411_29930 [Streptomyces pseudogriseolus]|uniref:hypothetical protein n=1 Tax=Streptomyces pseudogriseolus TaxID=36817 RepID=UPI00324D59C0